MSGEEEILGYAWREAHVKAGDYWMIKADKFAAQMGSTAVHGMAATLAALAQAHYAAANIRTRPAAAALTQETP